MIHKGTSKSKCDICGMEFSLRYHVLAHKEKVHQNISSKCSICSVVLKNSSVLKTHMKLVHSRSNEIECDLCDIRFKSSPILEKHHKRVHLKLKHFQCDMCDKSFFDRH